MKWLYGEHFICPVTFWHLPILYYIIACRKLIFNIDNGSEITIESKFRITRNDFNLSSKWDVVPFSCSRSTSSLVTSWYQMFSLRMKCAYPFGLATEFNNTGYRRWWKFDSTYTLCGDWCTCKFTRALPLKSEARRWESNIY